MPLRLAHGEMLMENSCETYQEKPIQHLKQRFTLKQDSTISPKRITSATNNLIWQSVPLKL